MKLNPTQTSTKICCPHKSYNPCGVASVTAFLRFLLSRFMKSSTSNQQTNQNIETMKLCSFTERFLLWMMFSEVRGPLPSYLKVVHVDDPEPPVTWTPPSDPSQYQKFAIGAKYVGLLFAGRAEFNWIVDLRAGDQDEEFWSVGNLITYHHVLTTCRALTQLEIMSDSRAYPPTLSKIYEFSWDVITYMTHEPFSDIRVNYCENYLWVGDRLEAESKGNVKFTDDEIFEQYRAGGRSVKQMIPHPQCTNDGILKDVGILVMGVGIPPLVPQIGYMPTVYDYVADIAVDNTNLDPPDMQTRFSALCYVASFGRKYSNLKNPSTLDAKVRYRVYPNAWEDCQVLPQIDKDFGSCQPDEVPCPLVERLPRKNLWCFRTRSKVGTVCDHDKGAPVVCNGVVVGLVTQGSSVSHCNNLYNIPFMVLRLDSFELFLNQAVDLDNRPVKKKLVTRKPYGPASNSPDFTVNFMLTLCIIGIGAAF